MRSLGSTELKRLHRSWRSRSPGRLALLLDSVQGPFNVGAIMRTAAAWRVEEIWTVGATPPVVDAKVQKTAMGTNRFVTVHPVEDPIEAVTQVGSAGYRLIALELADGARPLHEVDLSGAVCLAVGHEERGVSGAVMDAAECVAYLPQLGRVGSLNVATATAAALYEARRQGWA